MEIYLIRHTPTAVQDGVICGQLDAVPLEEGFEEAVSEISRALPDKPDMVYSSHLVRAEKLAEAVYPSEKVHEDPRIAELNFGEWEGKRWEEVPQDELNRWMENYRTVSSPGGESMNAMIERVQKFLDECGTHNYHRVVVFTHAGVIRVVHHLLKGVPVEEVFDVKVAHGQIFRFEF